MRTTKIITVPVEAWRGPRMPVIEVRPNSCIKDVWVNTNGSLSVLLEEDLNELLDEQAGLLGNTRRQTLCLLTVGTTIPGFYAYLCSVSPPEGGPRLLVYTRAPQ